MVKQLLTYVQTFFTKNAFFRFKNDTKTIEVKYCQSVKIHSSDNTIEVDFTHDGVQHVIDLTLNGSASVSLNLQHDVITGLNSGNNVTISQTPIAWTVLWVMRNGVFQSQTDYTRVGTTITFTKAFGPVSGGAGTEQVDVIYFY